MPFLFGLNPKYFIKENFEMRKLPEVARFLKYDIDEPTYPSLPPFLFPHETLDITQAFRMDQLVMVRVLGLQPDTCTLKASHAC